MTDPMDAFRTRFVDRCREDVETIRHGDDAQLRVTAHRIAGLAGTLGYPELSRLAARVDDQLAANGQAHPADRKALVEALAALIAGA